MFYDGSIGVLRFYEGSMRILWGVLGLCEYYLKVLLGFQVL